MLCVAVGVGMNGPEHGGVADDVHGRNPNLKREVCESKESNKRDDNGPSTSGYEGICWLRLSERVMWPTLRCSGILSKPVIRKW